MGRDWNSFFPPTPHPHLPTPATFLLGSSFIFQQRLRSFMNDPKGFWLYPVSVDSKNGG